MSQNITVSWRLSAPCCSSGLAGLAERWGVGASEAAAADSAALVGVPHSPQNFALGVSSSPQEPQATTMRDPHSSQNFAVSLLSLLQLGHSIHYVPEHRLVVINIRQCS